VGERWEDDAVVTLKDGSVEVADRDMAMIHHLERDNALDLNSADWGSQLRSLGWQLRNIPDRYFFRDLTVQKAEGSRESRHLREYMTRFPSAPIYGTNRKPNYGIEFPQRPNLHTMRVLTRPNDKRQVGRIFILHNGLNEATNLRFYYRLADWILKEDGEESGKSRSACLIAPFPGHLMHSPFPGPFTETPLLRYLSDSGELFRQFLRYMVEMRWLLSAVNRESPPDWTVGGKPIENDDLPVQLRRELSDLRRASQLAFERGKGELSARDKKRLLGTSVKRSAIESMVGTLQQVLGRKNARGPNTVPIHVIGYSLGGFLAQSVFFAWPNMVSSCATICSGGAIRALSPTAFAHSEEWQAVLHTLRPELEESMLRQRIVREGDKVAGIREDLFGYYQRIFDQVFLQEDHASYKARLSEYGTRMFFVGGGEDPIVKTSDVLDASPSEGITMLSVASLTHFLGETARTVREREQREFWLPEAGGLIARAAVRGEELYALERQLAKEKHLDAKQMDQSSKEAERTGSASGASQVFETAPARPKERDLESPDFEKALDWVIDGVKRKVTNSDKQGNGWIFVCRNGLPAAFLDPKMQRAWATGLHHHDVFVQKYALGLTRRAVALRNVKDRTTLVLPSRLRDTFVESSGELVDPHSDAPGYLATKKQRQGAWDNFLEEWGEQARWFHAGPLSESLQLDIGPADFSATVSDWQAIPVEHLKVTHVPDAWIMVDDRPPYQAGQPDLAAKRLADRILEVVKEEARALEASEEKALEDGADLHRLRASSEPRSDAGIVLREDLKLGRVRIVRVSAAELNPRYRGKFEQSFASALLLLAHCTGALIRSRQETPVDQ
jgi:hypothetical protein